MSALSFKITTDTAKINNFRKSLERLYELLEKFPSKSSGFKVINRHISDLETRVDQAIRKIAKMQQQAAESAAKVVKNFIVFYKTLYFSLRKFILGSGKCGIIGLCAGYML